jgi:hypothetical protein
MNGGPGFLATLKQREVGRIESLYRAADIPFPAPGYMEEDRCLGGRQ